MSGRGSKRFAARLLCAAATCTLALALPPSANAQTGGELDPAAPLDPMPELEVEWPELDAGEPAPAAPQPAPAEPAPSLPIETDGASERRYTVAVEGAAALPDATELLEAFRKQSALAKEEGEPANVAQIDRRSRADAELLAELLRARGYYDATAEARAETSGGQLRIVIAADPGQQYRFAAVSLPGLEQAGAEAAEDLLETFGVKAGDPVIAQDVIAGEIALRTALGEQGYAGARVGEQEIEINHQTRLATLRLPVDPGPVARRCRAPRRVAARPRLL